ncbi:MAG: peptidylprolyl isomerase [Candidatus Micrarchaeia archaeon]
MAQVSVKNGDSISVDYVGTLEDGTVFDTSVKAVAEKAGLPLRPSYEPLSFAVGAGQMIKGFDAAVVGMKVGEEKTVKIPAKDAYGERSNANVMVINTTQLELMLGAKPAAGMMLYSNTGAQGKITATNSSQTEVDFNHELAGKTLVFKITVRKIGA